MTRYLGAIGNFNTLAPAGTLNRARGYPETARGRGTGMVMGHSAAPATLLETASLLLLLASFLASDQVDSVSSKAVSKIRI